MFIMFVTSLSIFSVGKFVDSSFDAPCSPLGCSVQDSHTKKVVRIGRKVNWLFCLDHLPSSPIASTPTTLSIFASCISFDFWYKRLEHASSAKSVMCFSLNMILIRKVIVAIIMFLIDFVILTTLHSFRPSLFFSLHLILNCLPHLLLVTPSFSILNVPSHAPPNPLPNISSLSSSAGSLVEQSQSYPACNHHAPYLVCISIWLS